MLLPSAGSKRHLTKLCPYQTMKAHKLNVYLFWQNPCIYPPQGINTVWKPAQTSPAHSDNPFKDNAFL